MKAKFLLIFLLFLIPLFAEGIDDGQGNPSKALLDILAEFRVCHDGTWKSIQEETEKAWLSHGRMIERWEIKSIPNLCPEKTYELFSCVGLINAVFAQQNNYDYALVLGATLPSVRQRFWFLKMEWERGIRFSELVILTGDRALDPKMESAEQLLNPNCSPYPFRQGWEFDGHIPRNEAEMMQLVFDQLDLPIAWKNLPITWVNTPIPEGFKRPHTEHTVAYWLSMHPKPGTVAIVSNQPFIHRQTALLRQYLPAVFEIEGIGEELCYDIYAKEKRSVAVLLAELAYWIKIHTIYHK